jgi:hypothetical protein
MVRAAALCALACFAPEAARAQLDAAFSSAEGLVLELPQQSLRFDLDGRLSFDYVDYDTRNRRPDQTRIDRAQLGGTLAWRERASLRVLADLDGIDTRYGLFEAYAAYEHAPWLRASAGLQPLALGVEGSWPEAARGLSGMPGFAAFLGSRTDVALRLDGEVGEGLVSYDLAAAAGEGFDLFGQRRGDPQLSAAVTSYPLRFLDWKLRAGPYELPLVSGLFARGGFAWTPDFDGHMDVATPLRNKLFLTSRLDADRSSAWSFGYGVDFGPLRAVHEFARTSLYGVETPGGDREDLEELTAWQVLVSWRITGEPYDSRPFRQRARWRGTPPARPLDGAGDERGLGAFELSFRYANGDIDRDFFTQGFTDYQTSSQEFRVAAVGLAWDPLAALRFSAELARTIADQNPAVFDSHGRDTSWLLRLEWHF